MNADPEPWFKPSCDSSVPGLGDGGVEEGVGQQLGGCGPGSGIRMHHQPEQAVQLTGVVLQVVQLPALDTLIHRVIQAVPRGGKSFPLETAVSMAPFSQCTCIPMCMFYANTMQHVILEGEW